MGTPESDQEQAAPIDPWDDPPLGGHAAGWPDGPAGPGWPPGGEAQPRTASEDADGNWLDVVPRADPDGDTPPEPKVPRHLHLWLAAALALLTLAVLGLQAWLARAANPAASPAAAAAAPAELEPPLANLQHELARQRGERSAVEPPLGVLPPRAPAPAGSSLSPAGQPPVAGALAASGEATAAGAPPASVAAFGAAADGSLTGLSLPSASDSLPRELLAAPATGDAAYEQARAQAVIAGSRILALSHVAPTLSGGDGSLPGLPPPAGNGQGGSRAQLLEGLLRAAPELVRSVPDLLAAVRDAAQPGTHALADGGIDAPGAPPASAPGSPAASAGLHPRPPANALVILEGTPIACVLQTEVRSDLPGMLVAQVAVDVYDSVTAQRRLIPRGTRLVGRYDSQVASGQQRLMASFHRMILPDGGSVELQHVDAADAAGSAGLQDEVDTHFWQRFGQSFLTAGLARAVQRDGSPATVGTAGGVLPGPDATGQILVDTARTSLQAGSAQAPTLIIRRGTRFNVMVNRDLQLPELEGP